MSLSYLVSGPCGSRKKKMAAVEREKEESLKTELSAWDRRVLEADSVTLHPRETGRYDQRDGGICVCAEKRGNGMEKQ